MKALMLLIVLWSAAGVLTAQSTEDWVEAASNPEELSAWLDDLRREPLDLNRASAETISRLPFLDAAAARAIMERRKGVGGFRSLEQVLETPELTAEQRHSIREFACIRTVDRSATQARIVAGTSDASAHAFDGNGYWGRSNFKFKAAGRTGFADVRRSAYDPVFFEQTSAGLEIVQEGHVPTLALGDFQYEAGTGLVFASAYGMANWLSAPGDARIGRAKGLALRPSSDRRSLFRGIALQETLAPLEVTVLGSWNRLDGAISDGQADWMTEGQSSSDDLDRARRDQIEERLYGVSIQGRSTFWRTGAQGYQAHFSPAFQPFPSDPYIPKLTGELLRTGSVFAAVEYSGINAIAEAAKSNPGGYAYQGAISARSGNAGLTLYHVHADADFYSPHSKVWGGFGETASNQQSTGIRVSSMWKLHTLTVSASEHQTPFRTSTAPLGSAANELEARWTSSIAAPIELELLGTRTERDETSNLLPARKLNTKRGRIEARWRAHEEFRIRFEVRTTRYEGESSHQLSTLLFLHASTRLYETNVTGRLTFFGLEDEAIGPVQVFENSLPGAYPLVPLTGAGRRVAVTLSHAWNHISTNAKVSHTMREGKGEEVLSVELAVGLSYRQ
jgi:hypothetical protein